MLRREVVDACAASGFSIYAVGTVDEGIAILTGIPPGERDSDDRYPNGTVNALVEARLRAFADVRRRFSSTGPPSGGLESV